MSLSDVSRQFARLTYEAMFARAAGLLGSFVANIMIARALGAEGKGVLTILGVWSGLLASFFSYGIHLAVIYELGARPWHARRFFKCVFPYVFVATGLVVTGGILVQDIIGHPEIPLGLFASLFAVQLLCSLFYAILIGLRNQSAVNWLFAYGSIAYPALIGVLLVFRGNLDVLVVAVCMVLLPAVMGMYSLYLVLKQVASQEGTEERSFHWGSFLQYAAKSTAMGAGSIIYLQVVVMVLSVRCNAADVGVFSVAMMLIDTTMVIPSMIIAFVLPRWSGLSRAEVFIRASRVVRLTHPITLLIAVGVTVLGIALAEPIFGKDFTEVGKLALIMVPGAWATTGITVVSTCFLAQNQHKVPTILAWMGAVLAGGLVWWLLPVYGCIGAAMAVSISRLVMLSWGRYEFRRADPGVPHVWWTPTREDFHAWSQIIGHTLQKVRKGS